MRLVPFAVAFAAALLAGCESKPLKPELPQQQPQAMPQIRQEEATPRYKAELRTELAEAIKFAPPFPQIYTVYGLVYTELGDERKAEEYFRRGLDLAPNDSEIRHNWGWYLCTH